MAKYRCKPLVIEAEQWFLDKPHPKVQTYPYNINVDLVGSWEWTLIDNKGDVQVLKHNQGWIETLEGGHIVSEGDYIVKGTHGEFYPVKEEIFNYKYEKVAE